MENDIIESKTKKQSRKNNKIIHNQISKQKKEKLKSYKV